MPCILEILGFPSGLEVPGLIFRFETHSPIFDLLELVLASTSEVHFG